MAYYDPRKQHSENQYNAGRDINARDQHSVGGDVNYGTQNKSGGANYGNQAGRDINIRREEHHHHPPPVPPKSRAGSAGILTGLIVLVIFLIIVAFIVALGVTLIPKITSLNLPIPGLSTPKEVLSTYCTHLRSGDSATAYDQYSDKLKSQITASDFVQKNKFVSNCIGNISNTSAQSAKGTVTVTAEPFDTTTAQPPSSTTTDYDVTLIKDSNGDWKIDSMTQK
ncbi:MAG: hypothetical protein JOZ18_14035 [Chloroflexi bacterium]|nr:hypothetical protein [Chloroflexota bacterium]